MTEFASVAQSADRVTPVFRYGVVLPPDDRERSATGNRHNGGGAELRRQGGGAEARLGEVPAPGGVRRDLALVGSGSSCRALGWPSASGGTAVRQHGLRCFWGLRLRGPGRAAAPGHSMSWARKSCAPDARA